MLTSAEKFLYIDLSRYVPKNSLLNILTKQLNFSALGTKFDFKFVDCEFTLSG